MLYLKFTFVMETMWCFSIVGARTGYIHRIGVSLQKI